MDDQGHPDERGTNEPSRPVWLQLAIGLLMGAVLLGLLGVLFRQLL